ncbi:MAG: gliding motility protein GldB-related protein, partial [Kaistella sp.]
MKFFRYLLFSAVFVFAAVSCQKEAENIWNVDLKEAAQNVEVTDISKEFYDTNVPLEEFRQKYPWFQGSVSNEDYSTRRTDTAEVKIYKEAISKIDAAKLNKDLTGLFSHIKYHFPEVKEPKVFLFSSVL